MDTALIISNSENSIAYFISTLKAVSYVKIESVSTCAQAKRLLGEKEYDICIINSPLSDESGESLSLSIAARGFCQVILVVRSEYYNEVAGHVEEAGVIAVAKPIDRAMFLNAVKLAKAAQKRIRKLQTENSLLIKRIDDIRVIDRAKCVLISYLAMSEPEAHKYIEKQSMDMQKTKRVIAEGI
ncbi:MAG: ANTAR domain-containing protein, partial [Clostridiales bacterium]|nr:ANTAR domain-containing protein [Clostridiales bacterium]